jgi:hypothetical protein
VLVGVRNPELSRGYVAGHRAYEAAGVLTTIDHNVMMLA